jgi:hypothetical protein
MPILDKTSFNASDKLDFLLNSLACQAHGAISQLSSQVNISRKTIYATRDAGIEALQALLSQIDTVRQVKVDEPQLRRTIVSLSIAATWSGLFEQGILQGMMPSHVVKDGGLGMKKAVRDSFPNAEQRDDVFHAL